MSNYTTQLRFICESYAGRDASGSSSDVDEIIELARPKIFDFNYPIFDPEYKKELESKIIQHYYTQEIGLETVGLWKLKLRTKMREIMPFYNKLYRSELLEFNPFINTDYRDEHSGTGSDSRTTEIDTTKHSTVETDNITDRTLNSSNSATDNRQYEDGTVGHSETTDGNTLAKTGTDTTNFTPQANKSTLVKHSDTPLGSVDNVTADGSNYLSDVTETIDNYGGTNGHDSTQVVHNTTDTYNGTSENDVTNTNTGESTDTHNGSQSDAEHTVFGGNVTGVDTGNSITTDNGSNTTDYAGRIFGKTGSETYSEMLMKFRDTFLNIDMQVINELDGLFMQLW